MIRTKKISKRFITALLAAVLVLSGISMLISAPKIANAASSYGYNHINVGDYIDGFGGLKWRVIDKDTSNGLLIRTDRIVENRFFDETWQGRSYVNDGVNFDLWTWFPQRGQYEWEYCLYNTRSGNSVITGPDHTYGYGTNLWRDSDTRNYLNGTNRYAGGGFTSRFTSAEWNLIGNTYQKTLLWRGDAVSSFPHVGGLTLKNDTIYVNNFTNVSMGGTVAYEHTGFYASDMLANYDNKYHRYDTDKIFLPDVKQSEAAKELRYPDNTSYKLTKDTSGAIKSSWLRMPCDITGPQSTFGEMSSVVYLTGTDQQYTSGYAHAYGIGDGAYKRGITPMLYLVPTTTFTNVRNSNGTDETTGYKTYGNWANEYTVSFNSMGGSYTPNPQTVIEDKKAVKPTDPVMYEGEKRGFVGWFNGDKKWDFTKDTVTSNITLTAKWGYTVTFDTDGGTPAVPAQAVEEGGKATTPAEVKLGENKATGWYYGDKKWNFAQDTITGNITLKAKYGWNVTFQTEHGNNPPMQLVAENGKIKEPTAPSYGGTLKFEGWYYNDKKWDFAKDTAKSDMTLKAKWKDGYIIEFDTDGGSAKPPRQILQKDEKVVKPTDPTKEKYVFKGWYIDDFWGGTEWDFAKNFVDDKDFTLKAKWVEAYTVKYDADGGTPAPPDHYVAKDPKETTDRTIKPKPADPKKEGFALKGWYYIDPNSLNERKWIFETDIVTDDMTLHARWEEAYTVTFDADGGTPAPPKQPVSKTGNLLATKPADPKKKGFVIVGWNYIDIKIGVEREWNFAVDKVDGDITLSAKWEAAWTVTFNADGGTPAPSEQNILNGKMVTKVPDPKKASAVFVGWFVDEFSGKQWNFETDTVTKNITLKAKWETTYTVTFDVNRGADSGSAAPDKQVLKVGDKLTEPDAPTRKDHTFLGWYNGDKLWSFVFDTVTGDMTLKAKWQEGVYTVKFNADGGSPQPATQTIYSGDFNGGRVNGSLAGIPFKYGYRFLGWYNGKDHWDFFQVVTADMTLKAKWEKVCYVNFDPAGGTMATGYDFYTTPPKYLIYPPPTPIKNGYLFQGWYKADNTLWNFAADVVTDHMTLTAKWESLNANPVSQTSFNTAGKVAPLAAAASSDIAYVVTLNASGGLSAPAQQGIAENGLLTAPDEPTRPGYKFLGWYLGDKNWDFNSDRLTDALTKTVSTVKTSSYTNVTLSAKWERLNDGSVAVNFNTDGGGTSPREQIIYGNKNLMPVEPPAKEGYVFLGWYNGDMLWDFLSDIPSADITLTAKWAKIDDGAGTGSKSNAWLGITLICISSVALIVGGLAMFWFVIKKKKFSDLFGKKA